MSQEERGLLAVQQSEKQWSQGEIHYDLHIHSTASDGLLTPEELVDEAVKGCLIGMAVTDHDTVAGLHPAIHYCGIRDYTLDIIPGIELNTEMNGKEVHILGYFIDYDHAPLLHYLEHLTDARFERARQMVQRLKTMGFAIEFHRVQQLAGNNLIARPHVARALMEKGYVFSVKEAFDKYISKGRPAYVPRYKFQPEMAIQLIQQAGGISVLAHPGLIANNALVEDILEMGIEGIEVFYPDHREQEILYYMNLADRKGLLVTGGSDFHGDTDKVRTAGIGSYGVNAKYVEQMRDYQHQKLKNI